MAKSLGFLPDGPTTARPILNLAGIRCAQLQNTGFLAVNGHRNVGGDECDASGKFWYEEQKVWQGNRYEESREPRTLPLFLDDRTSCSVVKSFESCSCMGRIPCVMQSISVWIEFNQSKPKSV